LLSNTSKAAAKAKNKYHSKITADIILLHDNTCPHVANTLHFQLKAMKWEVVKHGAYIPALLPLNFHAWTFKQDTKDVPSHQMSVQKALGCGQGIPCRPDVATCAPMGLMSKCLW
jgi:hypothetical protein